MKFSTCITNENIVTQPFTKILDTLVEAGFDGVDLPGDAEHYPIKTIQPILETYGKKLQVAEVTACMNPSRDLVHPDPKRRQLAIQYIKDCIQAAADVGTNLTHMCFLSFPDNLAQTPRAKLEQLGIQAIQECHQYAADRGVRLLIEPLFKGDVSLINRAEQAVDLYAKALKMDVAQFMLGTPYSGLLLDIFHMHHEEENVVESLKKYGHLAYHIHVADHPRGLDFTRKDSGFVKEALHQLKSMKYSHFVSFESFDASVKLEMLKDALKTLKSL